MCPSAKYLDWTYMEGTVNNTNDGRTSKHSEHGYAKK